MDTDRRWLSPPPDLILSADDLHVWSASLKLARWSLSSLRRTLTQDELDRAERYRFAADRDRFIAGRGLLRVILGHYLGLPPERLRFCYGPQEKPVLEPDSGGDGLQFNVSHCHDLALFAVTRSRRVGIDLECIRPLPEADQIAERFFSAQERSVFRALPEGDRQSAFFRCWTRKEAFIKAEGQGLSLPLDGFDVSLAPGQPARLLAVKRDPEEASRWSLCDLWPAPGFVAAVAAEGSGWRLCRWQWREDALRKSAISHGAGVETSRIEGYSFS